MADEDFATLDMNAVVIIKRLQFTVDYFVELPRGVDADQFFKVRNEIGALSDLVRFGVDGYRDLFVVSLILALVCLALIPCFHGLSPEQPTSATPI
jgi:hypothetical protein